MVPKTYTKKTYVKFFFGLCAQIMITILHSIVKIIEGTYVYDNHLYEHENLHFDDGEDIHTSSENGIIMASTWIC